MRTLIVLGALVAGLTFFAGNTQAEAGHGHRGHHGYHSRIPHHGPGIYSGRRYRGGFVGYPVYGAYYGRPYRATGFYYSSPRIGIGIGYGGYGGYRYGGCYGY